MDNNNQPSTPPEKKILATEAANLINNQGYSREEAISYVKKNRETILEKNKNKKEVSDTQQPQQEVVSKQSTEQPKKEIAKEEEITQESGASASTLAQQDSSLDSKEEVAEPRFKSSKEAEEHIKTRRRVNAKSRGSGREESYTPNILGSGNLSELVSDNKDLYTFTNQVEDSIGLVDNEAYNEIKEKYKTLLYNTDYNTKGQFNKEDIIKQYQEELVTFAKNSKLETEYTEEERLENIYGKYPEYKDVSFEETKIGSIFPEHELEGIDKNDFKEYLVSTGQMYKFDNTVAPAYEGREDKSIALDVEGKQEEASTLGKVYEFFGGTGQDTEETAEKFRFDYVSSYLNYKANTALKDATILFARGDSNSGREFVNESMFYNGKVATQILNFEELAAQTKEYKERENNRRKYLLGEGTSYNSWDEANHYIGTAYNTVKNAVLGTAQTISTVIGDKSGAESLQTTKESSDYFTPILTSAVLEYAPVEIDGEVLQTDSEGTLYKEGVRLDQELFSGEDIRKAKDTYKTYKETEGTDTDFSWSGAAEGGVQMAAQLYMFMKMSKALPIKNYTASMSLSTGIQTYYDNYNEDRSILEEALKSGELDMSYDQIDNIARTSGGLKTMVTMAVSTISPNKILAKGNSKTLVEYIKQATGKGRDITLGKALSKWGTEVLKETGKENIEELTEYVATKGVNALTNNFLINKDLLDTEIKKGEVMNIAAVTTLGTGTMTAAKTANSNISDYVNQRNEMAVAQSKLNSFDILIKSSSVESDKAIDEAITTGVISSEEGKNLKQDIMDYRKFSSKIPKDFEDVKLSPKSKLDLIPLLKKKAELEEEGKELDGAFKEDHKKKVDKVQEKINNILFDNKQVSEQLKDYKKEEESFFEKIKLKRKSDVEEDVEVNEVKVNKEGVENEGYIKGVRQKDTSPKVVIKSTEKKLLTERLRNEARVSNKAKKGFMDSISTIAGDIKDFTKTLQNKDRFTKAEVNKLNKVYKKLNGNNAEVVADQLVEVLGEISSRIKKEKGKALTGKALKPIINTKAQPNKVPANISEAAKTARSIDVNALTESELDEVVEVVNKLKKASGVKNARIKKITQEDLDILQKYSEKSEDYKLKNRVKAIAKKLGYDVKSFTEKIDDSGLTGNDLLKALSNDPEIQEQLDKELLERGVKREALVELLQRRVNYLIRQAKKAGLPSNFTAFNAENIGSITDLSRVEKVLSNMLVNEDYSDSGIVKAIVKNELIINKLKKVAPSKVKAVNKIFESPSGALDSLRNIPSLITKIANGNQVIVDILYGGIFSKVSNANLESEAEVKKVRREYDTLITSIVKSNPEINSVESKVRRSVLATLLQSNDIVEFDAYVDNVIKPSLEVYAEEFGIDLKSEVEPIINEIKGQIEGKEGKELKDTINNIYKNKFSDEHSLLEFFIDKFKGLSQGMVQVNEEVFNNKLEAISDYYLPTVFSNSPKSLDEVDPTEYKRGDKAVRAKNIGSSVKRNKKATLPKNKVLHLDFDSAMLRGHKEETTFINTSEAKQQSQLLLENNSLSEILGTRKTKALIKAYNNMLAAGNVNSVDNTPKITNIINRLNKWGRIHGLSSVAAGLKQATAVSGAIVNVMDPQVISKAFSLYLSNGMKLPEVFKNSSVTYRKEMKGGAKSKIDSKIDADRGKLRNPTKAEKMYAKQLAKVLSTKIGAKTAGEIIDLENFFLYSLTQGDLFGAKLGTLMYSLKHMKDNGVDISKIKSNEDFDSSKGKEEAISHADVMIGKTMGSSDSAQQAKIFSTGVTDNQTMNLIIKSVFLPFQSFVTQAKMRIADNLMYLTSTNSSKQDRLNAGKDLMAVGAEILAFNTMKVMLSSFIEDALYHALVDYSGQEDPEELDNIISEKVGNVDKHFSKGSKLDQEFRKGVKNSLVDVFPVPTLVGDYLGKKVYNKAIAEYEVNEYLEDGGALSLLINKITESDALNGYDDKAEFYRALVERERGAMSTIPSKASILKKGIVNTNERSLLFYEEDMSKTIGEGGVLGVTLGKVEEINNILSTLGKVDEDGVYRYKSKKASVVDKDTQKLLETMAWFKMFPEQITNKVIDRYQRAYFKKAGINLKED